MKGPGMKLDLDVRRVWQCPKCGKQQKADGQITAKRCNCTKDDIWMKLVEPRRQVKTFPMPGDKSDGVAESASENVPDNVSDDVEETSPEPSEPQSQDAADQPADDGSQKPVDPQTEPSPAPTTEEGERQV